MSCHMSCCVTCHVTYYGISYHMPCHVSHVLSHVMSCHISHLISHILHIVLHITCHITYCMLCQYHMLCHISHFHEWLIATYSKCPAGLPGFVTADWPDNVLIWTIDIEEQETPQLCSLSYIHIEEALCWYPN